VLIELLLLLLLLQGPGGPGGPHSGHISAHWRDWGRQDLCAPSGGCHAHVSRQALCRGGMMGTHDSENRFVHNGYAHVSVHTVADVVCV
jgi:hypothetical protein